VTGLMDSDDAMIWAQEFCRIFDGFIVGTVDQPDKLIDEGTMVGWFANAMVKGEQFAIKRIPTEGPWYAFLHLYYMDKANAAVHCAPVWFSPVTFRLAEHLFTTNNVDVLLSDEFGEVHAALGAYEEDKGR
jgi:hypothetical protein